MKLFLIIPLFVLLTAEFTIPSVDGLILPKLLQHCKSTGLLWPKCCRLLGGCNSTGADLPNGAVVEIVKALRTMFGPILGTFLALPVISLFLKVALLSAVVRLPFIRLILLPVRIVLYIITKCLRSIATLMYIYRSYKSFTK